MTSANSRRSEQSQRTFAQHIHNIDAGRGGDSLQAPIRVPLVGSCYSVRGIPKNFFVGLDGSSSACRCLAAAYRLVFDDVDGFDGLIQVRRKVGTRRIPVLPMCYLDSITLQD